MNSSHIHSSCWASVPANTGFLLLQLSEPRSVYWAGSGEKWWTGRGPWKVHVMKGQRVYQKPWYYHLEYYLNPNACFIMYKPIIITSPWKYHLFCWPSSPWNTSQRKMQRINIRKSHVFLPSTSFVKSQYFCMLVFDSLRNSVNNLSNIEAWLDTASVFHFTISFPRGNHYLNLTNLSMSNEVFIISTNFQ